MIPRASLAGHGGVDCRPGWLTAGVEQDISPNILSNVGHRLLLFLNYCQHATLITRAKRQGAFAYDASSPSPGVKNRWKPGGSRTTKGLTTS